MSNDFRFDWYQSDSTVTLSIYVKDVVLESLSDERDGDKVSQRGYQCSSDPAS